MKKLKILFLTLLGALVNSVESLTAPRGSVALANSLGQFNEHGVETLQVDPASANIPVGLKYLIYKRGATGALYADVGDAASYPLGISSDAPYAIGDQINIRRFGARKGIELGIASAAITIDHLLYVVAGGKLADLTAAGNGTYWVVGRATQSVAANNSTMECSFVPCVPYQITVSNGGGTYAFAGAGV